MLWADNRILTTGNIILTPLWYNGTLQIPIKREWLEKGINTVWDIIDCNRQPMTMEVFKKTYNVKTNFLEYGVICQKVKDYLWWKD